MKKSLRKIKMIVCDVDGVLTDGSLWISDDGKWRRQFHIRDGVGIKLAMQAGFEFAIISGGKSDDLIQRMNFLGVKRVYLDASDKVPSFDRLLKETGIKADEVAYVGDEIFDIPIFNQVGFSASVPDAVSNVRKHADYVTKTKGGFGAVREVIDLILIAQQKYPAEYL